MKPLSITAESLIRLRRIPGLIVAIWLCQIVLAKILSLPIRHSIASAYQPYSIPDDSRTLFYIAETLLLAPQTIALIALAVVGAGVASVLFNIAFSGAIVSRLDHSTTKANAGGLFNDSVRVSIPIAVQLLWLWVLRAIILLLPGLTLDTSAPIAVSVGVVSLLALSLTIPAFEIVRIQLVRGVGGRFSPMVLWTALRLVWRHPIVWICCVGLTVIRWVIAASLLLVFAHALDSTLAIWAARVCSLVGITLVLLKTSVVLNIAEKVSSPLAKETPVSIPTL